MTSRSHGIASDPNEPKFNRRALLILLFQANIHSIMGSEDQVLELMLLLDTGLQQAMKIEEKLDEYEQKLQVSGRCPSGIGRNVAYEIAVSVANCVLIGWDATYEFAASVANCVLIGWDATYEFAASEANCVVCSHWLGCDL